MAFIFSIHVPITGVALVPLIPDWPLVLTPVRIVFLELIIDPACSIAFEAESAEANLMNRPPRDSHAPLFSIHDMVFSLLQGGAVMLTVLFVLGIALYRGLGETEARALTFSTLHSRRAHLDLYQSLALAKRISCPAHT